MTICIINQTHKNVKKSETKTEGVSTKAGFTLNHHPSIHIKKLNKMSWLHQSRKDADEKKKKKKEADRKLMANCHSKSSCLKTVYLHPVPDYQTVLRRFKNLDLKQEDTENEYQREYIPLPSERCQAARAALRETAPSIEVAKSSLMSKSFEIQSQTQSSFHDSSSTSQKETKRLKSSHPTLPTRRSSRLNPPKDSTESKTEEVEEDVTEIWDIIDETPITPNFVRSGMPGDFFFSEICDDDPLLTFTLEKTVIDSIGNTGYCAASSGKRVVIDYQPDSGRTTFSKAEIKLLTKTRLARKFAKLLGVRSCSDNVHQIKKALWLLTHQKSLTKQNVSDETFYPALYKCHETHRDELDVLLKTNPTFRLILVKLDEMVKKLYPALHAYIKRVIPKEFRLFEDLIWTQCGMTGGENIGQCEPHVDRRSIVNAIMTFANDSTVGG